MSSREPDCRNAHVIHGFQIVVAKPVRSRRRLVHHGRPSGPAPANVRDELEAA
jgi:hypothetical protein